MDDYQQVEGRNPVLEALRGPRRVMRVFIATGTERSGVIDEIVSLAGSKGIRVEEIEKAELRSMAQTSSPQGMLARVSPYRYLNGNELLEGLELDEVPLLLVLAGVEDPQNLGSLLRVADGAGASGVVIPKRRACSITPTVLKSSSGAAEHVRVARVSNISNFLRRLKKLGLWVVGTDSSGEILYHEADMAQPLAVVLGGEGEGIGRLLREQCDMLVRVPMSGKVSSLNVASAGAVLLFEARRQRSIGE